MQQVRLINKRDGNVVTNEESVLKGWKEKIRGERGAEEVETVEQEVRKISTDEERKALKMKRQLVMMTYR